MTLAANIEIEYKECFSLIDKDSDGFISQSEFDQIVLKMGVPEPKKISSKLWKDSGATNQMSYDQFKNAFLNAFVIEAKKQEIIEAFQVFDAEKTGSIHQDEIKLIFSQMGNQLDTQEISELVAHLKPDKAGKCNYLVLTDRMFTICREK